MQEQKPYHIPVLQDEVLEYLNPQAGGLYVDATFGGGGHTRALLEYEPKCHVIGMDWDLNALELNGKQLQEEFPGKLTLIWANFSLIDRKVIKEGFTSVDGILADFGTSFYQLTERAGFSIFKDTPLDMRMSPAHQRISAADVVNRASEQTLYKIFKEFGEEPKSRQVARLIVQERRKKPIKQTHQLIQILQKVLGTKKGKRIHPATKIFQALRIYVNKELENITAFLPAALRILKPGGRFVCISFHSLEDRLVKQFFKERSTGPHAQVRLLTKKVILPAQDEIKRNPASRSARLRALEIN